PTPVEKGRFQIPLDESCTTAVGESADAWLQVIVDGESLGRAKINAVPYALEATSATRVGSFNETELQLLKDNIAEQRPSLRPWAVADVSASELESAAFGLSFREQSGNEPYTINSGTDLVVPQDGV